MWARDRGVGVAAVQAIVIVVKAGAVAACWDVGARSRRGFGVG
jgi:hypothetical protein